MPFLFSHVSKMKTKDEITKKATFCFQTAKDKLQDENEECEASYYSGAWYAFMWALGEIDEV